MDDACASNEVMETLAARAEEAERLGVAPGAGQSPTRPRRLLICLDGVPFEVIRALKSRGMFDNFREPARLLSPFPTLTNVALAQMLGATPPQGYESLYFDRDSRELRGGVSKYIGRRTPDKAPSSYMEELDYQEPLPFEFLIYVATDAVWQADMRRFRERFLSSPPTRDFFGFLKATDGLLHIAGPERLSVAMRSLDRILRRLQGECGSETEIVVFSDHGMNLVENRRVHLQSHLRSAGYDVLGSMRARMRGSRQVAAPAFGLCGYVALYCGEEVDRARLARDLTGLEGVDFSVHRDDDGETVVVTGVRGRALVAREQRGASAAYRYEQVDGDPLGLAAVSQDLREEGVMDGRGFAPDEAWLSRTWDAERPDALANVFESVTSPRVRHTADVLVSLQDGYYYGAPAFSRMVRLLATHGNALRPSSQAFLMSTHRSFPDYTRACEARPLLRG